jgi:hypothetical protein
MNVTIIEMIIATKILFIKITSNVLLARSLSMRIMIIVTAFQLKKSYILQD